MPYVACYGLEFGTCEGRGIASTDLSNAEIVLGKLGVGLVPVLGLVTGVIPIMALVGLLGGIDPIGLEETERPMTSVVVIDVEGVPLKTTLRLCLKQLGLVPPSS